MDKLVSFKEISENFLNKLKNRTCGIVLSRILNFIFEYSKSEERLNESICQVLGAVFSFFEKRNELLSLEFNLFLDEICAELMSFYDFCVKKYDFTEALLKSYPVSILVLELNFLSKMTERKNLNSDRIRSKAISLLSSIWKFSEILMKSTSIEKEELRELLMKICDVVSESNLLTISEKLSLLGKFSVALLWISKKMKIKLWMVMTCF